MFRLPVPEKIALICHHQNIVKTYSQFNEDVNRLCRAMVRTLGLRKGDVAGCWSANVYECFVVQHALAKIGAINCSLSPLFKTPELEYCLKKGEFKAIFMPHPESGQESTVNKFHQVMSGINHKSTQLSHVVFVESNEKSASNSNVFGSFKVNTHGFNHLLSCEEGSSLPSNMTSTVTPEDIANIFWTSGTTGKPKGATSSHFTITNNTFLSMTYKRGIDWDNTKRICSPLPTFHGFVGMTGVHSLCTVPNTFVVTGYRYNPEDMVQCLVKYKCDEAWCVPAILVDILNHVKTNGIELPHLRTVIAAAAPVPIELTRQAREVLPNLERVIVAYGATETGPVATYPMKNDPIEKSAETVGSALDFTEVKIVSLDSGRTVNHGESGEILARGHNIMKGYWKDPEKTAEVIKNGWYHTGDIGTMDKEGYIKVVGRLKELIIRGGANVYPREVEELLHQHPNILVAAVCGVPHGKLGEQVCAWIKLRDPSQTVTVQQIKDFCKDKISYYKVPEHVLFVDTFPLTASGKVQKFAMTEKSIELLGLKTSDGIKIHN